MKIKRRKDKGTRLEKYRKSFFHALDGIIYAIKYEQNIPIISIAIILVTIFGFIFKISNVEWLVLVLLFALIFSLELVNSAIEAAIDLQTLETHELAKIAKDTASGATLIAVFSSIIIGLIIFIPKMFF